MRVGQHVDACKTVLGTILHESKHVHFSEYLNGHPVNPLQPGHLTPYDDGTRPVVPAISVRQPGTGGDSLATFVRGSVDFVADVYDTPSLAVPGQWAGMPVGPALVTWRLQVPGGKAVVPERVAVDFRRSLPPGGAFWSVYARGTYQNMSVFGQHYSWLQPGRLLFRLNRACFDTRSVPDGVYDLVVTATDSRGNTGSRSLRLTIHNRAGWEGS